MSTHDDVEPIAHFRGVWCPAALFDLIARHRLSTRDAFLLLRIDSFCKMGGRDCYASNKYLGEKVGTTPMNASRSVSNLIRAGLVVQTKFDGRNRHLKVVWSKLTDEYQDSAKLQKQSKQNCVGRVRKNSNRVFIDENTLNYIPPTSVGGVRSSAPRLRFRRLARHLADAVSKVHKINKTSNTTTWARSLQLLYKKDKVPFNRIKSALNWYCRELPTRYNTPYFLAIESGGAFREKFAKLEAAIKRESGEPREVPLDPLPAKRHKPLETRHAVLKLPPMSFTQRTLYNEAGEIINNSPKGELLKKILELGKKRDRAGTGLPSTASFEKWVNKHRQGGRA